MTPLDAVAFGAASGRGRSGRSVALRVSPTRCQRFPLAAERCSGGNAAIGLRALKLKRSASARSVDLPWIDLGARDGDEIHLGDVVDGGGTGASPRRGCACS